MTGLTAEGEEDAESRMGSFLILRGVWDGERLKVQVMLVKDGVPKGHHPHFIRLKGEQWFPLPSRERVRVRVVLLEGKRPFAPTNNVQAVGSRLSRGGLSPAVRLRRLRPPLRNGGPQ